MITRLLVVFEKDIMVQSGARNLILHATVQGQFTDFEITSPPK